jgi:hypothetical protein
VPLLTVFRGFLGERMFQRWRPFGAGPIRVIRVGDESPADVLALARTAIARLT